MASKNTPVELTEREAGFCFGMSKMTLVQDVGEESTGYYKMEQVEFYEFLGRVASLRFSSDQAEPLHLKIEKLLDIILPVYGMER